MGLTVITLMGRFPEKGVLVGLAVYEYINPRQGAVRCGSENPSRNFKSSTKIWTLQIQSQRGGILDSDSKTASKQCSFVNAGWYMGSYTADVDLWLGTNILGTHLPTPRGWTAELAGGYMCKQFVRLGSNPGPSASHPCTLTAQPH